jgi:hypothetical protein
MCERLGIAVQSKACRRNLKVQKFIRLSALNRSTKSLQSENDNYAFVTSYNNHLQL